MRGCHAFSRAFRLHTELDLPRVIKFTLATHSDVKACSLRRKDFPRTIQDAFCRGFELHAHQGAKEHFVRHTLLDRRVDVHEPFSSLTRDTQFESNLIFRSASIEDTPHVGALHATEQQISIADCLHRFHPHSPVFVNHTRRFGELGNFFGHVKFHVHRERVLELLLEVFRQHALDDVLGVVVLWATAALDTTSMRAVTAKDQLITRSCSSFTFTHAQTSRSARLVKKFLHRNGLHTEIERALDQLVLTNNFSFRRSRRLHDSQPLCLHRGGGTV
mmetsp:Transcript_8573/g.28281  ORF Transcript_8573/g.28281 Transcript_8573/m.28281 type:complete len:275 (-) Transcript_8573:1998-2822(-)